MCSNIYIHTLTAGNVNTAVLVYLGLCQVVAAPLGLAAQCGRQGGN